MSSTTVVQGLSLMIPRVFLQWTDKETIIKIFHEQHIGKIYKVDIIKKQDEPGRNYPIYPAFLYFSDWYENDIAYNFQQRIFGGKKQARVVYDDPWFWIVFENKKQVVLKRKDTRIMRMGYLIYQNDQRYIEEHKQIEKRLQVLEEKCGSRGASPVVVQVVDTIRQLQVQEWCDCCIGVGEEF